MVPTPKLHTVIWLAKVQFNFKEALGDHRVAKTVLVLILTIEVFDVTHFTHGPQLFVLKLIFFKCRIDYNQISKEAGGTVK